MRRKRSVKRDIPADRKYQSALVQKFINYVMLDGKKTIAEKVVYGAFDIVEKEAKQDPFQVFNLAIQNASPILEVRSRRVGGANYQIPREVRGDRRLSLAFRWLITGARSRSGSPMDKRLAEEIMLAAKNEGTAVKKKTDMHRMAEANKAFAHFAW